MDVSHLKNHKSLLSFYNDFMKWMRSDGVHPETKVIIELSPFQPQPQTISLFELQKNVIAEVNINNEEIVLSKDEIHMLIRIVSFTIRNNIGFSNQELEIIRDKLIKNLHEH